MLRGTAPRRDGLAILAAGVAGYFLAVGNHGPAGGLFRFGSELVTGFVMMREPWIANPAAQQGRCDPPPRPLDHAHASLSESS